jgi:hypothetical protein
MYLVIPINFSFMIACSEMIFHPEMLPYVTNRQEISTTSRSDPSYLFLRTSEPDAILNLLVS